MVAPQVYRIQGPLIRAGVTAATEKTPEPVRKIKTNEPRFVVHTARVGGDARGVRYAEIDRMTSENARRFYRWQSLTSPAAGCHIPSRSTSCRFDCHW